VIDATVANDRTGVHALIVVIKHVLMPRLSLIALKLIRDLLKLHRRRLAVGKNVTKNVIGVSVDGVRRL